MIEFIIMGIIGVIVWLGIMILYYVKKDDIETGFVFGMISFVVTFIVLCIVVVCISEKISETTTIDVWYTDAPFGTYWVEQTGRGNFICYRQSSNLRESYTIKYWDDNDELHDLYFESMDDSLTVYRTSNTSSMKLEIETIKDKLFLGSTREVERFYALFIPNPDLMRNEAKLLTDGIQKPIGELKEAGREFDNLLMKGESEVDG